METKENEPGLEPKFQVGDIVKLTRASIVGELNYLYFFQPMLANVGRTVTITNVRVRPANRGFAYKLDCDPMWWYPEFCLERSSKWKLKRENNSD
jgi:hypothetical protein